MVYCTPWDHPASTLRAMETGESPHCGMENSCPEQLTLWSLTAFVGLEFTNVKPNLNSDSILANSMQTSAVFTTRETYLAWHLVTEVTRRATSVQHFQVSSQETKWLLLFIYIWCFMLNNRKRDGSRLMWLLVHPHRAGKLITMQACNGQRYTANKCTIIISIFHAKACQVFPLGKL